MKGWLLACAMVGSTCLVAQVPNRFGEEDSTARKAPEERAVEPVATTPQRSAQKPAAQPRKKGFDPSRLIFGGQAWASFASGSSFLLLSPSVGYRITDKFWSGVNITYMYQTFTFPTGPNTTARQEQSVYGGSLWTRYYPIGQLFGHVELEGLNGEFFDEDYFLQTGVYQLRRSWVPAVYAGLGYGGGSGGVFGSFAIMWNLLYDPNRSFFANPIIRLGVGFSF
jgi:hypothetical protein